MISSIAPFLISFASLLVTGLTECLNWVLVYRNGNFQKVKDELERFEKKSSKFEIITKSSQTSGKRKKEARNEAKIQQSVSEISSMRSITNMMIGFVFMVFLYLITSFYDQQVVAVLPFEPPPMLRWVTHRGLRGENFNHCSAFFIYTLCSMGFRKNVVKFLGWGYSRAMERQTKKTQQMQFDQKTD
eukprot:TRINITY_DN17140_c0_g1_i3.p1 TRINITY_DN17140_c0_g1~~TRINITY_DN17140_c0_g1_i3.p1  ORF type:complete len:187 (+),score=7.62 TRINITY_DN17140_c0_g1_i3:60-620(+)